MGNLNTNKRLIFLFCYLFFILIIFYPLEIASQEVGYEDIVTFKEWYIDAPIELEIFKTTDIVQPEETISLKVEYKDIDGYSVHTDRDVYSGYYTEEDIIIDPYWSCKDGNLSNKRSFSTTWTAPKKPGIYRIIFGCDDEAIIGEIDKGMRDDEMAIASIDIKVGKRSPLPTVDGYSTGLPRLNRIFLKDGHTLTGEIISEDENSIKAKIGSIEITIDKKDIDRIE